MSKDKGKKTKEEKNKNLKCTFGQPERDIWQVAFTILHYQPQQPRPTMDPAPAWSRNRLAEDAESPETVARIPVDRMRRYVLIVNILELGPVRFRQLMYGDLRIEWIEYP